MSRMDLSNSLVPSGPVIRMVSGPKFGSAVSWNLRNGQHSRSADMRSATRKTVSKLLLFGALELYLSEKQMPQVVGFIASRRNQESIQKG